MNVLLILNAKSVGFDLKEHFGNISPLMLPINDGRVIDRVYKKYKLIYDEIVVAVNEEKEDFIKYINHANYNITTIDIDKTVSIGYTLEHSLNKIMGNKNINNITIMFADTELTNTNLSNYMGDDVLFYSIVDESEHWTVFEKINNDIVIIDKKESEKECFNAFIGVFNFTDVYKLYELLYESNKIKDEEGTDSFYKTIIEYNKLKSIEFKLALDWEDLGHIDRYIKVKQETETRYFNSIKIDSNTGILTKTSTDIKKFINEINWYLKIPKPLEYLIPRIFEYDLKYDNPSISMEYYSYPTLHNIYLYSNYNISQWRKIIKVLFNTLEKFKQFKYSLDKVGLEKTLKEIYLYKTIDRLNELKKDKRFDLFFKNNITINNKEYKSLEYYIKHLDQILMDNGIYELDYLNIIHGDYFFANILYDPKINMIKLIDPRGDFGGCGIYGDRRYEFAKLAHSIDGKYDFIVKDLFSMKINSNIIEYNIYTNDKHEKITQLFFKTMENYANIKQINLIQSLLFLSMVPLHKDYFERQIVMLCTGIAKLQQVIDEVE